MYKKHFCDACQRCLATQKTWVQTRYSITTQLDLCKPCMEIMDEIDMQVTAEYTLVREKIEFLRNMPLSLQEELDNLEYELKEERARNKQLEKKIGEMEEW